MLLGVWLHLNLHSDLLNYVWIHELPITEAAKIKKQLQALISFSLLALCLLTAPEVGKGNNLLPGFLLNVETWLFIFADQHILRDLEKRKILVFTPSRRVAGKRVVCNDDWFIVKLAYESDGIVVSNDMYRDLQGKEPEWKRFIEERLLMYSFVNNKWVSSTWGLKPSQSAGPWGVPGEAWVLLFQISVWMSLWCRFMPPDDPLGRYGPTLENFLRRYPKTQKKPLCPYGKSLFNITGSLWVALQ